MRTITLTDHDEKLLYDAFDIISAQTESNDTVTEALKDIMAVLEMN
jgi:hypothetical protein